MHKTSLLSVFCSLNKSLTDILATLFSYWALVKIFLFCIWSIRQFVHRQFVQWHFFHRRFSLRHFDFRHSVCTRFRPPYSTAVADSCSPFLNPSCFDLPLLNDKKEHEDGYRAPFPNPWVTTPNGVAKSFSWDHQSLNALRQVISNI